MCDCELIKDAYFAGNIPLWWGYVHISGGLHVKRWRAPPEGKDCDLCYEKKQNTRPFIRKLIPKIVGAYDRVEAARKLKDILDSGAIDEQMGIEPRWRTIDLS